MNLSHFFGDGDTQDIQDIQDSKNKIKTKSSTKKRESHEIYKNLLNKFMTNHIIEMPEYTFMIDFAKSKGPIVSYQKYIQIFQKIIANLDSEQADKDSLVNVCSILFKHLVTLFSDNNINIDYLVKDIEEYNQNTFTFTKDQVNAIKHICNFLHDSNSTIAGLYGFAGTGKTTTITKLINYLLSKNYINSVVFTAPTNKAVNVIKSKFRSDLDDLIVKKLKMQVDETESFNDMLDKLEDKGFKVNFLTIHKLLNYQNDFDIEGERIFIKGDKTTIDSYDLVVVDECSMIPFQIIVNLVEEAVKNKNSITNKIPKVLFIVDPAQLPPVNEIISSIFAKKISDLNYNLYKTTYLTDNKGEMNFDKNLEIFIKKKFDVFAQNIISMKYVVLKEIMRSNSMEVIGLCNEMRAAVLNEIKVPKFHKYAGKKVFLYKYDSTPKIGTSWFHKCVEYFQSSNKQQLSNIILTWTNKQTDEYNDIIRKTLYKKTKLDKFEIGDILILTDFYNMKETEVNQEQSNKDHKDHKDSKKNNSNKRFYSSEQIKVTDIERVTKACTEFTENLPKKMNKIKNINVITEKYIEIIKFINKNTVRKYSTWKLYVHKLSDIITNTIPETYQIYVVSDESNEILLKDRKTVANKIRELRNYYKNVHKESLSFIDNNIIMPLWKELNKKLVDPFAKVNIAMSITTHRCQGSNYYNVFVDAHDILKNGRMEEAKRCLYTALSRTSNELHVLI